MSDPFTVIKQSSCFTAERRELLKKENENVQSNVISVLTQHCDYGEGGYRQINNQRVL
jgi:hypothetical protein